MKKSIFLSLVTIMTIGGSTLATTSLDSLRVATANLNEGDAYTADTFCSHFETTYENVGVSHAINCIECGETLYEEAHVDENNDMRCDACPGIIYNLAPSQGKGYVESEITTKESVKISIKANSDEVVKVIVSSWYDIDSENVYEAEATYNSDTNLYEVIINFSDVNGADGTYNFDATIYDEAGNMRYVRISEIEFAKNGVSKVTTTRTEDGTIEVTIEAEEGGEIYIGTNGEEPTDEEKWQTYTAGETYTLEDDAEEVKTVNVYYRSAEAITEDENETGEGASNEYYASTYSVARAVTDPKAMITEWTIPEANTTIILPVERNVNLTVDWGDGTTETVTTYFKEHTYATAGTYDIAITGTCMYWGNNSAILDDVALGTNYYTYANYLTGLKQWGELGAYSYGFSYCTNLKYVLGNSTENTFNNTKDMGNMFNGCTSLTSIDLSNFDTSNVTYMFFMFRDCGALTSIDVSNFNTSNVTSMSGMFWDCSALTSIDLSNFDTSNVTSMSSMFWGCNALTSIDLSNFDTSNVTDMGFMFYMCSSLTSIDVSNFNTSNVRRMSEMFFKCSSLTSLNVSNFDTSNVTDMNDMFCECSSLTSIDLSNFETSNVIDMAYMFYKCSSLTSIDVSNFETSNVTDMSYMFYKCDGLTTLDLSSFNTANVTDMASMFVSCSKLNSILISNKFTTTALTEPTDMFSSNLSAIMLTSTTPNGDQFGNVAGYTSNATFYVSNNSVSSYRNAWSIDDEKIQPIISLKGESEVVLVGADTHVDEGYTVAGFEEDESSNYTTYGYTVTKGGVVNPQIAGTYPITYTLSRNEENAGTVLRNVVVPLADIEVTAMVFGKEYDGNWTNGEITLIPNCDESVNVTAYQYKFSGDSDWSEITQTIKIHENINNKVLVRGLNPSGKVVTNVGTSNTLKIDIGLPSVTLEEYETIEKTVTISLKAQDALSGLKDYAIATEETATKSWNNILNKESGDIKVDVHGSGTYYVWVKDNAGNISNVNVITVVRDTEPPKGAITVKEAYKKEENVEYTKGNPVTLQITATDNVSMPSEIQMALYKREDYDLLTSEGEITWEQYVAEKEWTLPSNNIDEEVMLVLKDKAGNISAQIGEIKVQTASYQIKHYVQNVDDANYTLYKEENKTAMVGKTIELESQRMDIPGTTYEKGTTSANGTPVASVVVAQNGSTTIYLFYTRNTYTLTLEKGANIASLTGAGEYKYGKTVNITATTETAIGYTITFNGWNSSNISLLEHQTEKNVSFEMPSDNITLKATATKEANKYTVKLNANGGTVTPTSIQVAYDSGYGNLPTPIAENATFLGWYTAIDGGEQITSTTVNKVIGEQELYARYDFEPVAIYSETDHSLRFVKPTKVFNTGDTYNGKVIKEIYTNVEEEVYDEAPWAAYASSITSVVFEDAISPVATAYWFSGFSNITGIDFTNLDTSNVTTMESMFSGCGKITSLDLTSFDTTNVTNMANMFADCTKLETFNGNAAIMGDANLDGIVNVEDADLIKLYAAKLITFTTEQLAVSDVDESGKVNVIDANLVRKYAAGIYTGIKTELAFNTSKVTNMSGMFKNCTSLEVLDVIPFDTASVTNMSEMFSGCTNISKINLVLETANVTNMKEIFKNCSSLLTVNVSNFDTSKVTDMTGMFEGCTNIKTFNGNVTILGDANLDGIVTYEDYRLIREYAAKLKELTSEQVAVADVNDDGEVDILDANLVRRYLANLDNTIKAPLNFNTSGVMYMANMFKNCSNLEFLDLVAFNTSNVSNMADMFSGCSKLQKVNLGSYFEFVGTNGYLPVPDDAYITDADGKWYSMETGTGYIPSNVPNNTYATYSTTPRYVVTFNANGGTIAGSDTDEITSVVVKGKTYQEGTNGFPDAVSAEATFIGWFTEMTDGNKITGDTLVDGTVTTLYAHWKTTEETISSIANEPVLGPGMQAVYWTGDDGTGETRADEFTPEMYSYVQGDGIVDSKDSKWANAITVEDESYWVWIPRYAYKITYYTDDTKTTESEDKTLYGDIDILFMAGTSNTHYRNASGIATLLPEGYIVHPSFQAMTTEADLATNPLGKWKEDLEGIWVAKYETSQEKLSGSSWVASTESIDNELTSSTMRMVSKPSRRAWGQISEAYAYQNSLNMHSDLNSHQMKNSEWGAVTYLAHSSYGRNGNEVSGNNCSWNYTGGGPVEGKVTVVNNSYVYDEDFSTTYAWNTTQGKLASTTGNIYGVYDMAGGTEEYVAAYVNNGTSVMTGSGRNETIFYDTTAMETMQIYPSNGSNGSSSQMTDYALTEGIYGDSIWETSTSTSYISSWNYKDTSRYPYNEDIFFTRGSSYYADSSNIFDFGYADGVASSVMATPNYRPVLCVSKVEVTFDANGGNIEGLNALQTTRTYAEGKTFGSLSEGMPTAILDGYNFLGWFTAAVDGTEITDDTVVDGSITKVYAHYEEKPAEAFAVYSETDNSLTFYKRANMPAAGDTYNGKVATAVYTGFEETVYTSETNVPWYSHRTDIESVLFADEIKPISTAYWFKHFTSATTFELNNLNTSNVTNMAEMFSDCTVMTSVDLTGFDTSKVTNMSSMFDGCVYLATLNLSSFDTSKVNTMSSMFYACYRLKQVTLGSNFAFVGTNGYLPSPSSEYISGVDGDWYNTVTKVGYDANNIPNNTAATYTAIVPSVTITFYANGGNITGLNAAQTTRTLKINTKFEDASAGFPTATWTGYNFAGWYTEIDGGTEVTGTSLVSASVTNLYARWNAIEYTITYNLDGGTLDGENPTTFTIASAPITLINPTKGGYTFLGWATSAANTPQTTLTIPTGSMGNRTYIAFWEEIQVEGQIVSIANEPVLGEGMKAVYWTGDDGTGETRADAFTSDMYNYTLAEEGLDSKNSKWANAITTSDESYWVWIPRYAYKITYYTDSAKTTESETKTQYGDIDIVFMYGTSNDEYRDANGNAATLPDDYIVHPAFQEMTTEQDLATNPLGKWDEDLAGIWVAKYELSKETYSGGKWSAVNTYDAGNTLTSSTIRAASKPSAPAWRSISQNIAYQNALNMHTELESHQMKNSEWGAIAYLTHSSYGRNGTEVSMNKCSPDEDDWSTGIYTGAGPGSTSGAAYTYDSSTFVSTYAWNTELGKLASSTGNIYGVYDLSGGINEYTASYLNNGNTAIKTNGASLVNGSLKTKQLYPSAVTNGESTEETDYELASSVYGDAVYETSIAYNGTQTYNTDGWNRDYTYYVESEEAYFVRGGYVDDGRGAGIFAFERDDGTTGNYRGYRAVLCVSSVEVTFDANGGTIDNTTATKSIRRVGLGTTFAATSAGFPTATKDGATFLGWFTATTGGDQVTESTVVDGSITTVYAQWKEAKSYIFKETEGLKTGNYYATGGLTIESSYMKMIGCIYDKTIIVDGESVPTEVPGYNGMLIGTQVTGSNETASGTGFDITNYNTMYVDLIGSSTEGKVGLVSSSSTIKELSAPVPHSMSPDFTKYIEAETIRKTASIDISSLSGEYFVTILSPGTSWNIKVYNIWFE